MANLLALCRKIHYLHAMRGEEYIDRLQHCIYSDSGSAGGTSCVIVIFPIRMPSQHLYPTSFALVYDQLMLGHRVY